MFLSKAMQNERLIYLGNVTQRIFHFQDFWKLEFEFSSVIPVFSLSVQRLKC